MHLLSLSQFAINLALAKLVAFFFSLKRMHYFKLCNQNDEKVTRSHANMVILGFWTSLSFY